jgi:hypothetical protein
MNQRSTLGVTDSSFQNEKTNRRNLPTAGAATFRRRVPAHSRNFILADLIRCEYLPRDRRVHRDYIEKSGEKASHLLWQSPCTPHRRREG